MKTTIKKILLIFLLLAVSFQAYAQTNITLKRHFVDESFSNTEKFYRSIKAIPYYKNGLASGLKLLQVNRDSFFQKLGLKRGDIMISVDDQILNIQSGLKPFFNLNAATESTLIVERDGKDLTINIKVVRK